MFYLLVSKQWCEFSTILEERPWSTTNGTSGYYTLNITYPVSMFTNEFNMSYASGFNFYIRAYYEDCNSKCTLFATSAKWIFSAPASLIKSIKTGSGGWTITAWSIGKVL